MTNVGSLDEENVKQVMNSVINVKLIIAIPAKNMKKFFFALIVKKRKLVQDTVIKKAALFLLIL